MSTQNFTDIEALVAQRNDLDKKIAEARQQAKSDAVRQIQEIIARLDLTPEDIFSTRRAKSAVAGRPVAPKYRNNETGETWTGRGKPPAWIKDKNRDDYLIA